MKEKTEVCRLRLKKRTIKRVNAIAAREGRTFAAQAGMMIEKQLKKGA
jgi:hypothetical protein